MKKTRITFIGCLLALAAIPLLHAQNLDGNWQGVVDYGPQSLRIVVSASQGDDGVLKRPPAASIRLATRLP